MRAIDEIREVYADAMVSDEEYLEHIGTKRHSGRYPWGSGKHPYQHANDFYSRILEMKKEGMSDKEICDYFGFSKNELIKQRSAAKSIFQKEQFETAQDLMKKGMSRTEAAVRVGLAESSLRTLEKRMNTGKVTRAEDVAKIIKQRVDEKGVVDLGQSVELELGISAELKEKAILLLQDQGYQRETYRMSQVTNPDQKTSLILLARPDIESDQIKKVQNIHSFIDYEPKTEEEFDGEHPNHFVYPNSIDGKRIKVRYNTGSGDYEDGSTRDGTIELRPGVADLNLGGSNYAQVRIMADGSHYLKGMAIYGDPKDFPTGVDVIFNTNKKPGTPLHSVLKPIKEDDPDNPFGTLIKDKGQTYYYDEKTGTKKLSLINKCREEGDWDEWSRSVPSQMLSKQNTELAKRMMLATLADKREELNEIMSLTQPIVKRHFLEKFAEDCDSNAVSLKTKAFPGQRFQVILPLTTLKDNEIYAPNYENGTKLALIRYPHGGIFEIPIVTVNNNNKEGKKKIGAQAIDAVGITSKVAEQLSGADFDGDTVQCIPLGNGVHISTRKPLEGLINFNNKDYKFKTDRPLTDDEYKSLPNHMKKEMIGKEMGAITNLIADMTLKGASWDKIERADKHSMVVIDAYKHHLDYKQSEKDFDIPALKKEFQGKANAGASTIITKASSEERVSKRKPMDWYTDPETGKSSLVPYNPATGEKMYREKKEYYLSKKTGKLEESKLKSSKMAETNDARTLLGPNPTPMELLYADYANSLKGIANEARKAFMATKKPTQDKTAKQVYAKEVESLEAGLLMAKKNQPRERIATVLANQRIRAKIEDNPRLATKEYKEDLKKIRQQEMVRARSKVGAERYPISINDREWEAIQSNAIPSSKLEDILKYGDTNDIRRRAMPKETKSLTTQQQSLIKSYSNSGLSNQQIAERLGISVSSVVKYLK